MGVPVTAPRHPSPFPGPSKKIARCSGLGMLSGFELFAFRSRGVVKKFGCINSVINSVIDSVINSVINSVIRPVQFGCRPKFGGCTQKFR